MIKPMDRSDIPGVVDLHHRILHWSANSRLGKRHIFKMYSSILELPRTFGFVYMYQDRIVGFITCSLDSGELRECLGRLYSPLDKLRMVINSLLHPEDLVDILESAFLVPRFIESFGVRPEIATFVTNLGHSRAPFAAMECMNAAQEYILAHGSNRCMAVVLKRNRAPQRFAEDIHSVLLKSYWQNLIYLVDCRSPVKRSLTSRHRRSRPETGAAAG